MSRLPVLARRRSAAGLWWRPGMPVYRRPDPDDTTLAELALTRPAPGWEIDAMHWTPLPREAPHDPHEPARTGP